MILFKDCRHFKGNIPCVQNKKSLTWCNGCDIYDPITMNILIIKLGAIGDVIRTTPILNRLISKYPAARIYWLTLTPCVLPKDKIDYILNFNAGSIEVVKNIKFDLLLNLDKSLEACAITNSVQADCKRGYELQNGIPSCINNKAHHKYITGIFDVYGKNNKKHYVEEIFEICDIGKFNDEPYVLNNTDKGNNIWNIGKFEYVIGLNTGCGERWKTRMWPDEYWIDLAKELIKLKYEVILLGGEAEDKKNISISLLSKAKYFGFNTLSVFIDLIDNCDLIVSQVTLATHVAIGLKKKIVLMNNIFNPNEFYLYGLGKIIEPNSGCDCYYLQKCKRERHCMKDISVQKVLQTIDEVA
uniref:Putative glycosyltransferase n=1 Tax=viral metagenome TaxID=1070528 RepID=A0A6H1ZJT3_9ZZZZ